MNDRIYAARGPEELPDAEAIAGLSGLEFMQALLRGDLRGAPMAGTANIWLTHVAEGVVRFRGIPGFAHQNPVGAVHGGWYGTLLDSALGCAVMTAVPRGSRYTTLEYRVNIVRAIPAGAEVECEAILQHAGRSTAVARGEIRSLDGATLHATGSTTCIILPAR